MTMFRYRQLVSVATALVLLAACQGTSTASPTPAEPEAAVVPIVTATGQVVPEAWADLSLASGGVVASIDVAEGDVVSAGDVLLRLSGREQLQAALAAAQVERVAAQQALDAVREQADVARAAAQSEWANARETLRQAEYKWQVQQEGHRASGDTIKGARARLLLAQEEMDRAKRALDRTHGDAGEDAAKAAALAAYIQAKAARDAAQRALNWYTGKPTDIQQALLDAEVAVAEARVAAAERAWREVQDGIDPDTLAQAEARFEYAQAQVAAAERALADSELRAPFDGTVASVDARAYEWLSPGQSAVSLGDLKRLQVETTDLNEIDAARVEVGAAASVTFDALPDVQVSGRVVQIAPRAAGGSGVNYTVIVQLDEIPARLRWGMTAFVDIEVRSTSGG